MFLTVQWYTHVIFSDLVYELLIWAVAGLAYSTGTYSARNLTALSSFDNKFGKFKTSLLQLFHCESLQSFKLKWNDRKGKENYFWCSIKAVGKISDEGFRRFDGKRNILKMKSKWQMQCFLKRRKEIHGLKRIGKKGRGRQPQHKACKGAYVNGTKWSIKLRNSLEWSFLRDKW